MYRYHRAATYPHTRNDYPSPNEAQRRSPMLPMRPLYHPLLVKQHYGQPINVGELHLATDEARHAPRMCGIVSGRRFPLGADLVILRTDGARARRRGDVVDSSSGSTTLARGVVKACRSICNRGHGSAPATSNMVLIRTKRGYLASYAAFGEQQPLSSRGLY